MASLPDEWTRTLLWSARLVSACKFILSKEAMAYPRILTITPSSAFFFPGRFTWLHPEKIPSAINRYTAEVQRVLGVLDRCLQGKQWLVGDKMTFADLAFLPWNALLAVVLSQTPEQIFEGFPNVRAWYERLAALPSWQRTLQQQEKYVKEQKLGTYGQPEDSELSLAEYASQHDAPKPG